MTEPTQRERLEYALVSGAAATLAQLPGSASDIATGIQTVLDRLCPQPLLTNPHTGAPRDPRDVASDPQAILCTKPGEPLKAAPGPVVFGDEEHVAVPRGLIGAACSAIEHKREGTNTLAELRRYTFGDKSAALPQAASIALPVVDPGPDSLERAHADTHASAVLYPAIKAAMEELQSLHPGFNDAVNRAFNHLHGAFWSECPAPASAPPLRPVNEAC